MASLAEMQEQLATLETSLRSGQLRVQHGEKAITYRSAEEMRQIIGDLKDAILAVSAPRKRAIRMRQSGRGY